MSSPFKLHSKYSPTGDQPQAISKLVKGLQNGFSRQTLKGVTGSGKTFTMANIIAETGKPALIISHNKTLAAQLYSEFKEFFPENAVEYFISYYDYYQPEAYIPQTDTYIEKDAMVNEEIERLRLSAANSLLSRDDVIVVASVSCIYGLGDPVDYSGMIIHLSEGEEYGRDRLLAKLVELQYQRNDIESAQGTFRVRGDVIDIFPAYRPDGLRVEFFGDDIDAIRRFDPLTMKFSERIEKAIVSPAKQFVMPKDKLLDAIPAIEEELAERLAFFKDGGKALELQRLDQRTHFDLDMLRELGYCSGIENYSRHLGSREPGTPPPCLIDYFQSDFITLIDESHVTLPQLRAMYNGDQARKKTLIEHGFRLPSAADNRPLNFTEFEEKIDQMLFVSATPGDYEAQHEMLRAEQVIRPTGLLDPDVEVRPVEGQIDDLISEIRKETANHNKVMITTLTKRMAEDLTNYMQELGIRVKYLHSDIDTLERAEIIRDLRLDVFDVLVGINLLREGLDIPEITLVAILDADKEGFLRSETSLIQTIGRAARNSEGHVIMYADSITDSMRVAIDETKRRREIQQAYNEAHGITPQTIQKAVREVMSISKQVAKEQQSLRTAEDLDLDELEKLAEKYKKKMEEAAADLNFEIAAEYRDQLVEVKNMLRDAKVDQEDKRRNPRGGRSGKGYHKSRRTPW